MTRVGLDPAPGNDRLLLKSSFVVRGASLADLDPASDGLTLAIGAADLPPRVEVDLPPGTFGGTGTRGWLHKGSRWLYKDATGAPVGGIASVTLLDRSRTLPGLVQIVVKGKDGTYPLEPGDLPAVAQLELGAAGCARTFFATTDCDFSATTLTCRGR
jgi:hypothetical protein